MNVPRKRVKEVFLVLNEIGDYVYKIKDLNLLLIENELNTTPTLLSGLQEIGFENVHQVRSAKQAFFLASDINIDLIISDTKINDGTDGIHIVEVLQKLYKLPVVFISSCKDKETLTKVSRVESMFYLLKPFGADSLETILKLIIIKYNLLINRNNAIGANDYIFKKNDNSLYFKEKKIKLSKKEKLFMTLIFNNINTYVPYAVIEQAVWHDSFVTYSARRIFFFRIKHKLKEIGFQVESNIGIGLFK